MARFEIVELVTNDLPSRQGFEWEDQDITGFTFKLHVQLEDGSGVVTRTAVIDDANVGGAGTALFHVDFQAGDLPRGEHDAELEVFDGDPGFPPLGKNETFKGLRFRVSQEIA